MQNYEKLGAGFTAIMATIGVAELPISDIISAITQIVIAIGTLIAIFKKKK